MTFQNHMIYGSFTRKRGLMQEVIVFMYPVWHLYILITSPFCGQILHSRNIYLHLTDVK